MHFSKKIGTKQDLGLYIIIDTKTQNSKLINRVTRTGNIINHHIYLPMWQGEW